MHSLPERISPPKFKIAFNLLWTTCKYLLIAGLPFLHGKISPFNQLIACCIHGQNTVSVACNKATSLRIGAFGCMADHSPIHICVSFRFPSSHALYATSDDGSDRYMIFSVTNIVWILYRSINRISEYSGYKSFAFSWLAATSFRSQRCFYGLPLVLTPRTWLSSYDSGSALSQSALSYIPTFYWSIFVLLLSCISPKTGLNVT